MREPRRSRHFATSVRCISHGERTLQAVGARHKRHGATCSWGQPLSCDVVAEYRPTVTKGHGTNPAMGRINLLLSDLASRGAYGVAGRLSAIWCSFEHWQHWATLPEQEDTGMLNSESSGEFAVATLAKMNTPASRQALADVASV